jgi:hypothetical protein
MAKLEALYGFDRFYFFWSNRYQVAAFPPWEICCRSLVRPGVIRLTIEEA